MNPSNIFKVQTSEYSYLQKRSLPKLFLPRPDCLCKSILPLTTVCQLIGIIPLLGPDPAHDQINHRCAFRFKYLSIPSLASWSFWFLYSMSLVWCFLHYRSILVHYFQGTDLYAHEFKILTTICAGSLLLVYYRVKSGSFVKCVNVLGSVWTTLDGTTSVVSAGDGNEAPTWKQKLTSPQTLSQAAVGLILVNTFLSGVIGALQFMAANSSSGLYMLQVVTMAGLTATQQTTAFTFALLCLITRALFLKLGSQLKAELGKAGDEGRKMSGHKLEQIRLLHIALCKSNKYLSEYLGLPVLCLCCVGVITLTCGIYNFIFNEEELFGSNEAGTLTMRKIFYILFYCEMYCAVLGIGAILVSGQMLSNSVSACIDALHESNLMELDEKSEFQVMVCLQSIKASSCKLTASNMATIGMGFIASAVTNTTTYILVLLQFRLGGSDSDGDAASAAAVHKE